MLLASVYAIWSSSDIASKRATDMSSSGVVSPPSRSRASDGSVVSSASTLSPATRTLPLLPEAKSATNWNIPPEYAPISPSFATPASRRTCSGSYPWAVKFCNIAAVASCIPSPAPPTTALLSLPKRPMLSPPSFLKKSVIPGIFINLATGGVATSSVPIPKPLRAAVLRCSSVAP